MASNRSSPDKLMIGVDLGADASIVVARRTADGSVVIDETHRLSAERLEDALPLIEVIAHRAVRDLLLPRGARWMARSPRVVALLLRLRPSLRSAATITIAR